MPSLRQRRTAQNPEIAAEDEQFQVWLGARIRELRGVAQMNQEDFSYLVGVQRSYMGLIENGHRDLRLNTLRRIARSCGLEVHQLLDPSFELSKESVQFQTDDL